jgi:hypothetical protein
MMTRTKLSFDIGTPGAKAVLVALLCVCCALAAPAQEKSAAPVTKPAIAAGAPSRYQPNRFPRRAAAYYGLFWGIDSLSVKAVESGELIRFNYRVLDADKAKALNDKKSTPYLIAMDQKVRLSIPSLEKVGQLRQSSTPEDGRTYWMAFANPGRKVRRGDRVNVVIGQFQAEGLIVE